MSYQVGITAEGLRHHLVQQYRLVPNADLATLGLVFGQLLDLDQPASGVDHVVIGLRTALLEALAANDVPSGAHDFAGVKGPDHEAPATQQDLALWFQADAPEHNLKAAIAARRLLNPLFELADETAGFIVGESLDLTGFEDGTENPNADEAPEVAFVQPGEPGQNSSYMFVQRWIHSLQPFWELPLSAQEAVFGRTRSGSEELDPLPDRSHVERVVMQDAEGEELEIYRRSFPYGSSSEAGLLFLAFSNDPTRVEMMLERMFGVAGDSDRLIEYSSAVSGANYIAPSYDTLKAIAGRS